MATKRKREAIQQDEDPSSPLHKKPRIEKQKGPPSSKIFEPKSDDQQQYKKIFLAIYDSTLIINYTVPRNVIKHISEFATGAFYECCNDGCNEQVSFLWENINAIDARAVNCAHCDVKLYWHFCSIHNKYCTSTKNSGTNCQKCHCAVCHNCIQKCKLCGQRIWICVYCVSPGNECELCAQNLPREPSQRPSKQTRL